MYAWLGSFKRNRVRKIKCCEQKTSSVLIKNGTDFFYFSFQFPSSLTSSANSLFFTLRLLYFRFMLGVGLFYTCAIEDRPLIRISSICLQFKSRAFVLLIDKGFCSHTIIIFPTHVSFVSHILDSGHKILVNLRMGEILEFRLPNNIFFLESRFSGI